jgi:hypothetical protein
VPRYFLDRSLGGVKVPWILREAGWDLITMHEHYGRTRAQSVDDVTWITELAGLGCPLLTADARIVSNIIEARAIDDSAAVVFILPKGDMTAEEMATRFDRHRAAIDLRAERPGPAAFAVYPSALSQVHP